MLVSLLWSYFNLVFFFIISFFLPLRSSTCSIITNPSRDSLPVKALLTHISLWRHFKSFWTQNYIVRNVGAPVCCCRMLQTLVIKEWLCYYSLSFTCVFLWHRAISQKASQALIRLMGWMIWSWESSSLAHPPPLILFIAPTASCRWEKVEVVSVSSIPDITVSCVSDSRVVNLQRGVCQPEDTDGSHNGHSSS